MTRAMVFSLAAAGWAGLSLPLAAVDFDSEVFPILKQHCAKCHMNGESKGKVSLDKNLISKEINNSIKPGDVKGSDLHFTMTLDAGEEGCMPPKGPRVPPEQIAIVGKWIEEGAKLGGGAAEPTTVTSATPAPAADGAMDSTMGGAMASASDAPKPAEKKPFKGTFKNRAGMQLTNTTLTRVDGDRAILVLPDGKEYRYPLALFADETQELVKKFQEGTLATP